MIEFEAVSKTYRHGATGVVDLSLTVPSGQVTVLVGPPGCGNATALQLVLRMIEPTRGRITWDGAPLRSKRKTALRRQLGYVSRSGGLFPHRTVLDNIGTVPGLLRWSKAKSDKRSLELLTRVGLDRTLARRYPAQLSAGQRQRVSMARALAAGPPVLLMDDPFSAVDPVVRGELHECFLGLQRELSKTTILVTDNIDEAILLGDQVAVLRPGGRLAQIGTPQELLDDPADTFVDGFIGRDRGYRSLSFLPAGQLTLDRVKVVREAEAATGHEPTLVIGGDAKPIGWLDPARAGQVFPLGSTFRPDLDNLRVALNSALTSPFGLAVAVDRDTGRYAGVVAAKTILDQIADARAASVESISVRAAESGREAPVAALTSGPAHDAPVVDRPDADEAATAGPVSDRAATGDRSDDTLVVGPQPAGSARTDQREGELAEIRR